MICDIKLQLNEVEELDVCGSLVLSNLVTYKEAKSLNLCIIDDILFVYY